MSAEQQSRAWSANHTRYHSSNKGLGNETLMLKEGSKDIGKINECAEELLANGFREAAERRLQSALKQNLHNGRTLLLLSIISEDRGQLDSAVGYLKDCIEIDVYNDEAHVRLAEIYFEGGAGSTERKDEP